jgi:hypothetical protein
MLKSDSIPVMCKAIPDGYITLAVFVKKAECRSP